jgi:hypothetical protein
MSDLGLHREFAKVGADYLREMSALEGAGNCTRTERRYQRSERTRLHAASAGAGLGLGPARKWILLASTGARTFPQVIGWPLPERKRITSNLSGQRSAGISEVHLDGCLKELSIYVRWPARATPKRRSASIWRGTCCGSRAASRGRSTNILSGAVPPRAASRGQPSNLGEDGLFRVQFPPPQVIIKYGLPERRSRSQRQ